MKWLKWEVEGQKARKEGMGMREAKLYTRTDKLSAPVGALVWVPISETTSWALSEWEEVNERRVGVERPAWASWGWALMVRTREF